MIAPDAHRFDARAIGVLDPVGYRYGHDGAGERAVGQGRAAVFTAGLAIERAFAFAGRFGHLQSREVAIAGGNESRGLVGAAVAVVSAAGAETATCGDKREQPEDGRYLTEASEQTAIRRVGVTGERIGYQVLHAGILSGIARAMSGLEATCRPWRRVTGARLWGKCWSDRGDFWQRRALQGLAASPVCEPVATAASSSLPSSSWGSDAVAVLGTSPRRR